MAAFLQASMVHGFQQAGTVKEIPKDVNPENVKFVAAHSAELAAFMKEVEALTEQES